MTERTQAIVERIAAAQRHGWICRLTPAQVREISGDIRWWTKSVGIPGPTRGRILRAAANGRGVRLSAAEVEALRAAGEEKET